jgi:hypothetical protein
LTGQPEWSPYDSAGMRSRVIEASCCGRYQLLQEGGAHVVTRRRPYAADWQETTRGPALAAREVFRALVAQHLAETQRHRP